MTATRRKKRRGRKPADPTTLFPERDDVWRRRSKVEILHALRFVSGDHEELAAAIVRAIETHPSRAQVMRLGGPWFLD